LNSINSNRERKKEERRRWTRRKVVAGEEEKEEKRDLRDTLDLWMFHLIVDAGLTKNT